VRFGSAAAGGRPGHRVAKREVGEGAFGGLFAGGLLVALPELFVVAHGLPRALKGGQMDPARLEPLL
jgi:hypothetical protein